MHKTEKPNFSFKERTKPYVVKQINLNLKQTLTSRKLHNLMIYREKSLRNILIYL